MLRLVIRFCVNEPWLVVLLAIGASIAGWFSYQAVPIDAIPNVGENQVIVLTPWPGRSPKDIEDQVTYPLSVSLLAVPGAESVRGKSMFGYSFVQVTFKDEIDFYWARSRVSRAVGYRCLPTTVRYHAAIGPGCDRSGPSLLLHAAATANVGEETHCVTGRRGAGAKGRGRFDKRHDPCGAAKHARLRREVRAASR